MSIPRELIEQLRKGNVVLFCGAGISISEGGIPSGGQLAQELIQRAGLSNVGNTSLPEVAQAYELEVDHHSLIDYITDRIEAASRQPLRTHQLIATLPFQRIITTNWDTLLEEALRQAAKAVVKVVRDDDIPYIDEEKVTLIKLHGTVDQRDTIVITGDDYYDVFIRLPATANQVRGYFATKTVLFLGYGLADEDFKRLYHEVERHLGKHKRRAYAVQLDPMPLTVKYWQQKNVQVITADATKFLEGLVAELDVPTPPPLPPTTGSRSSHGTPPTSPASAGAFLLRQPNHGTGNFNLEHGLQLMKDALRGGDSDIFLAFSTLENRLLENITKERLYGSTEMVRSERAQIVQELNRLAIDCIQRTFNELCQS